MSEPQKARILLIDDHAVVRAGIRDALAELDDVVVVGEVGDGRDILDTVRRRRPECILIDVTMPHFEPITAIRTIRAEFPDLKILVVSAYDDDQYVQGLMSAGVNGYHLKDQPLSDLRLAVQRVLAGDRWVTGRLLDRLLRHSADVPVSEQLAASQLTRRQTDIVNLLLHGYDNARIASEIGISVKTVENHLTRLYRQLDVQSRLEAVTLFTQNPSLLAPDVNTRHEHTSVTSLTPVLSGRGAHITVLIVDDNARFRTQMRRLITRLAPSTTVLEAGSVNAALQQARRHNPQLVFVDVVLDNEDGIECTRRLKPLLPGARILLISAYPDREFHQRGLQAGASALLDKKDLDSDALRAILSDSMLV